MTKWKYVLAFCCCSRANAKKWEVELQTLRNNNLRLNAALMESTTNVEQWKQQLTNLKEENAMLKKKVSGDALMLKMRL